MSKDITLFLRATDNERTCHYVSSALKVLCEDGYDIITVRFSTFETAINNKFIKSIVEAEKTWQEKNDVYIMNIISCTPKQLKNVSLRLLTKKGIGINLQIEDISDILTVKKKTKRIKRFMQDSEVALNCTMDCYPHDIIDDISLPIHMESLKEYNDEFISLFDKWLVSGSTEILNFTDVIKTIMLKEHMDCEYHSCLGRIISIDASGLSFWCRHNRSETELGQICCITSLDEIFSEGLFEDYLDAHLEKREFCKGSCSRFEICQGGCPLQCKLKTGQNAQCTEQGYLAVLEHITAEIKQILNSGDLSVLNKHARVVVLKTLALAPFSDIFPDKETQTY